LKILASLFRFHLSAIATLRDATGKQTPIGQYALQLLIIGYDSDDKPKLGSIILRTDLFFNSYIEEAEILSVNEDLVWRVHGMPDVATNILEHPESKPSDQVVRAYAIAMGKDRGRSLRLDQLAALAKRLAYYTSKVHPEVGGPNQIAILHKSSTILIDQPSFPDPPKPLFAFALFVNLGFPPGAFLFEKGTHGVFVRCQWVGDQNDVTALITRKLIKLDGNYFIGNIFTNAAVVYDGGPFYFDDSNRPVNSTLFIGPNANRDDKAVQHLVKAFPWLNPH